MQIWVNVRRREVIFQALIVSHGFVWDRYSRRKSVGREDRVNGFGFLATLFSVLSFVSFISLDASFALLLSVSFISLAALFTAL